MKIKKTLQTAFLSAMEHIARVLYMIGACFGLFFGVVPSFGFGVVNAGVLLIFLCGVGLFCIGYFLPLLKHMLPRTFKALHLSFFVFFIGAVVVYMAFVVSYRFYCANNPPPAGDVPQTVIVLGGGINGDQPKLMLSRRLDAAVTFLKTNTSASCVVTGGLGRNEDYTEAWVMRNFLEEQGIASQRIWLEDQSATTRENIGNAAAIIREHALSSQVVVITDAFHQLRAAYFCSLNSLQPSAVTCKTPWGLLPAYEVRELGSWVKALAGY